MKSLRSPNRHLSPVLSVKCTHSMQTSSYTSAVTLTNQCSSDCWRQLQRNVRLRWKLCEGSLCQILSANTCLHSACMVKRISRTCRFQSSFEKQKKKHVVADILWLLQTCLAKYQGQKVETSCCSVRINFYTSSSIYQISYCLSNNSRADTNWAKILTYKYKGFFSQAFWLYCKYFNFFLFWAASNGVH